LQVVAVVFPERLTHTRDVALLSVLLHQRYGRFAAGVLFLRFLSGLLSIAGLFCDDSLSFFSVHLAVSSFVWLFLSLFVVLRVFFLFTNKTIEWNGLINNNAAGTYQVGIYRVYVDTKGNTQIHECYIVS